MIFYWYPIFIGMAGALFFSRSKLFFLILILISFLLVGLKGAVDKDYYSYEYLFDLAPVFSEGFFAFYEYSKFVSMEIGFLFLNSSFKTLGFGFNSIFIFHSAISFIFIYFICRNISANVFFCFIFLYAFSFVGLWVQIRFGLASLGVLLSAILFGKGRVILAICVISFSLLFHMIAIAGFLAYALYVAMSIRGISIRPIVICVLLFSLVLSFLNLGDLLGSVLTFFNSRYEAYEAEGSGSRVSFFIRLILFVFLFAMVNDNAYRYRLNGMLFSMAVGSVLIWSFAWSLSIFYRVGVMFELGLCCFLIYQSYSYKLKYYLAVFALFLLVFWRLYNALSEVEDYRLFF